MHSFARDLRFGLRSLTKTPGFTGVVVLTLALGVGANTTIFSVVHEVLFEPLDFDAPDRLVTLWELSPDDTGRLRKTRVTSANYFDWADQSTVFKSTSLFGSASFSWTGSDEPEQLLGARVTAGYFSTLGVDPVAGRFFLPEDNEPGRPRTVVLGHGLWQRRFGGAPDVVGTILTFDGAPAEVIGVAPPNVYPTWPQSTGRMPFLPVYQEIFVPFELNEMWLTNRRSHLFSVIARLRDDTHLESARAEMDTIARRLELAYPRANDGERVLVMPYLDEMVGTARPALLVLLAAVGLVLLIACANLAGLFLVRSSSRRSEFALRAALGASRFRIARQLIAESLWVAAAGGVAGIGLAWVGVHLLIQASPQRVPRLDAAGMDTTVLLFAVALSLVTGVLFGLAPILMLSNADRLEDRRSTARHRVGRGLVVAELSLAVVLVVGAGLLVQSFWQLRDVDLGFRAERVLVAELALPRSNYAGPSQTLRLYDELLQRVAAVPDVEAVALAYDHPLDSNWSDSFRIVSGQETEESLGATLRIVSLKYFRAMGIDVVRGREFTALDDAGHPGAVIVNEAFARRYFPDADPLTRRLYTSTPQRLSDSLPDTFEIVGIVRNVKFLGPDGGDEPAFYLPVRQFPVSEMTFLARTTSEPALLAPRLRDVVWTIDPNLPVGNVSTMARLSSEALAQPRFGATLLGVFGVAALVLAAMGVYGLLAYDVSNRTAELGIRIALGAKASDVRHLVLRQGLRLASVGLALGVVLAAIAARAMSGLLFGVRASDPMTFAGAALFLAATALLASYIPARRATKTSPLTALQNA